MMIALWPFSNHARVNSAGDVWSILLLILSVSRPASDLSTIDLAIQRATPSSTNLPAVRTLALTSVATIDEQGRPMKRYLVPPGSADYLRAPASSRGGADGSSKYAPETDRSRKC
jgi:hypothetical protein